MSSAKINYVREFRESSFNDFYFMTKPEEFIYDHFPFFSKCQLLARRVEIYEFINLPLIRPDFFKLHLRTISHPDGVIHANNQINIIIATHTFDKFKVEFEKEIFLQDHRRRPYKNLNKYVVMFQDRKKHQLIVKLNLPYKGNYKLLIKVRNREKNDDFTWGIIYKIVMESAREVEPFPTTIRDELGPISPRNLIIPEHKIAPSIGMVNSKENYFDVSFYIDDDIYDIKAEIYFGNTLYKLESNEDEDDKRTSMKALENGCGFLRVYHIEKYPTCSINIGAIERKRQNDDDKQPNFNIGKLKYGNYKPILSYIFTINNNLHKNSIFKNNNEILHLFKKWNIENIGKQKNFKKFNLKMEKDIFPFSQISDEYDFTIKKTRKCYFKTEFLKYDFQMSLINDYCDCSYFENCTDSCKFQLKFPTKGLYFLRILAKEKMDSHKEFEQIYIHVFQVECDSMHNQYSYPILHKFWYENENLQLLEPFKKFNVKDNVKFEIKGLNAKKLFAMLNNHNFEFKYELENDTWSINIRIGRKVQSIKILAQLNNNPLNLSKIFDYNLTNNNCSYIMNNETDDLKEDEIQNKVFNWKDELSKFLYVDDLAYKHLNKVSKTEKKNYIYTIF